MPHIRLIVRLFLIVFHVLYALWFLIFIPKNHTKISQAQWQRMQNWNRLFLTLCGVKIKTFGSFKKQSYLVVSNHISWLDIPAINSVIHTGFVSKAEIAQWPIIGWLAKKSTCLFLQRGQHGAAKKLANDITDHIDAGNSMLFFPEGTTTDGLTTKRFHSMLFKVASHSKEPVLILAIKYPNAPHAAFIGETTFIRHFISILKAKETQVEVHIVEAVKKDFDSKQYAKYCETEIRKAIE